MFKFMYQAWDFVGGLSKPSKMPCKGWSIPAEECKVGSILRKVVDSVCSKCYALKGMYVFPDTRAALARRFSILQRALSDDDFRALFRAAFVKLLRKETYFRWHDAGDLQSVAHLILLADIANDNPHVKFWLPTRERKIVLEFMRTHAVPVNLTIRVSAPMMDGEPLKMGDFPTSTVHKVGKAYGTQCEAYTRDGMCGPCRLCWDRNVTNVSYPVH